MKTLNLIRILETSVAKNGAVHPLTVGHLLNIIKMVEKLENKQAKEQADFDQHIEDEWFDDMHRYGSD